MYMIQSDIRCRQQMVTIERRIRRTIVRFHRIGSSRAAQVRRSRLMVMPRRLHLAGRLFDARLAIRCPRKRKWIVLSARHTPSNTRLVARLFCRLERDAPCLLPRWEEVASAFEACHLLHISATNDPKIRAVTPWSAATIVQKVLSRDRSLPNSDGLSGVLSHPWKG